MDVHQRVAVLSCNLGGIDNPIEHDPQSVACNYFHFTDEYLPPRKCSMTPRLQAKIPKCFGWQLIPGYEYYLWIDSNLKLSSPDSVKYLLDSCKNHDIVVLKHPTHDTCHWEYRYNWRGLHNNAPSNYLCERYSNEWLDEQYNYIKDDKDYKDDSMVNGGIFLYRNTPEVHQMFITWWYYITRYCVMDQLSWIYVLKKSGLKVNILPDVFNECDWLEARRHKIHA
jgi:hypothetical protein